MTSAEPAAEARERFVERAALLQARLARLAADAESCAAWDEALSAGPDAPLGAVRVLREREEARVADALARIEAARYGRCGECAEPIDGNRLRRLPYAERCAACLVDRDPDLGRHLAEQHAAIDLLLASLTDLLGRLLASSRAGRVDLPGSDVVAELLTDLREELGRHFALEETDSYLAELERAEPALGPRIEAIRAQHGDLFELAVRLVGLARESAADRAAWGRIEQDLRELVDCMERHEDEERAIATEAFATRGASPG